MADTALSALTAASTLDGTELYYSVQGGADRKVTGDQIKTRVAGALGVAAGTSLALGGATIGSNALAVTGASALAGQITNALGTITTSQPLTVTQTWNAGGVTFKGVVANYTDTASASLSQLLAMQVGGTNQFVVTKDGSMYGGAFAATPSVSNYTIQYNGSTGVFFGHPARIDLSINGGWGTLSINNATTIRMPVGTILGWGAGDVNSASDTILSRKAANIISVDKTTGGDALGGFAPQTKAGAFVAADFPSGSWYVGRDTSGSTTKLYYNNAGTLMAVALT